MSGRLAQVSLSAATDLKVQLSVDYQGKGDGGGGGVSNKY